MNDTPTLHKDATERSGEDSPQSEQISQRKFACRPAATCPTARAAVGVALATLWATSDEDTEREGHVARFELLHRN